MDEAAHVLAELDKLLCRGRLQIGRIFVGASKFKFELGYKTPFITWASGARISGLRGRGGSARWRGGRTTRYTKNHLGALYSIFPIPHNSI